MKDLIEKDCSLETLNILLYSGFFPFIYSADGAPEKLREFISKNKPMFDEIEIFFNENGIKKYDEP